MDELTPQQLKQLTNRDLEEKGLDRLDFFEISKAELKGLLNKAYRMGHNDFPMQLALEKNEKRSHK